MELVNRFFQAPKSSFFLFGPRGTGKSTIVRTLFPEAKIIDLLNSEMMRTLIARPERLGEILLGNGKETIFVIDEVQKIPDLLPEIHRLQEENRNWRFILTGSSARKLKRQGVNLLAGRAISRSLHPFLAGELGKKFCLSTALKLGMIPVVRTSQEPEEVLRTYVALYIREEVQYEGLTRNIGNFSRFLEAISFSHASILNLANVARECQVERKTVSNFVQIIEDLLLAFRLPVFSKKAKREATVHEKFYLFDPGVFRLLRQIGPLDQTSEIDGMALEGLVAQHLRACLEYRCQEERLYYWRTRSGVEVDFVIYGGESFFAIEVKNSSKVFPNDLRSLKTFKEDYPQAQTYLLYRGKERLKMGDINCMPVDEFLLALKPFDKCFLND
ncbi:MAG: ATP-binding protein [Candidatus Riflebacteria bacterium]|nr:ATP-binding protein [Candidatus Riflebacteria bacterium]